jgi:hypothetical protein
MKKPHVHAELIKAWADGAEIQVRTSRSKNPEWLDVETPRWEQQMEYRIKPEPTDFDIHGVEVGDIWKILPADTVIAVRYVRSTNVMSLTGIDHDLTSLNLLLFRRGEVDKL